MEVGDNQFPLPLSLQPRHQQSECKFQHQFLEGSPRPDVFQILETDDNGIFLLLLHLLLLMSGFRRSVHLRAPRRRWLFHFRQGFRHFLSINDLKPRSSTASSTSFLPCRCRRLDVANPVEAAPLLMLLQRGRFPLYQLPR